MTVVQFIAPNRVPMEFLKDSEPSDYIKYSILFPINACYNKYN